MAHMLNMHRLKHDVSQLIVKEYLLPANAAFFLIEAVRFNAHFLREEALKKLTDHFEEAV